MVQLGRRTCKTGCEQIPRDELQRLRLWKAR